MSDALYQQALAVTAVIYRLTAPGATVDERREQLRRLALDLPRQVRRLAQTPSTGELVRLRSSLADLRQWLEEQAAAGVAESLAEFDACAGRLSRGLSLLTRPAP
ncbi:MAG: hypothetical protein Q8Q73_18985 [Stagnimonas sp.]|nr:hypothetical protein [Stagnimonas sp.]